MPTRPASAAIIRENNLSLVLRLIHASGSISRAEIIRRTGLSATTVSALANVLIESGFVREAGIGESSGGRRPILMEFNYQYRYALGIDMGASHVTTVVMDLSGKVISHETQRCDVINEPELTFAVIKTLTAQALKQAQIEPDHLLGVGFTVPTPLGGEALDRLVTYYMPVWEGILPKPKIRALFPGLPVYLENDANAGAIGEKWWGSGQEFADLAYIKIGIGVGSGLVINHQIYRGESGTAGEIGHTTIEVDGRLCRCGNHGCMEAYVGGPGLLADAQAALQAAHRRADEMPGTVEDLVDAALQGDAVCRQVIQNAGRYLGTSIANLLNLVNPGLVILGGELVQAGELLMEPIHASIRERVMPIAAQQAAIVAGKLGNDAIAIGAATLVIQNAFEPTQLAKTLNGRQAAQVYS